MDPTFNWSGSTPGSNPAQPSDEQPPIFPSNISSYFRRPTRVVKNPGRANSPRSLIRRKTTATAHAPSRKRSIAEGKARNNYFPSLQDGLAMEGRARPTSWHPSSFDEFSSETSPHTLQFDSNANSTSFLDTPFATTEANGLITPMTQPSSGEPFLQEGFAAFDDLSAQNFDNRYAYLNDFSAEQNPFWASEYTFQQMPPPIQQYTLPTEPQGFQKQPEYLTPHFGLTAPTTPDILPIQSNDFGTALTPILTSNVTSGTDELVGMGLYDAPSPMHSSTLFSGKPLNLPYRSHGGGGKGLKLEETFQPSATEDNEEEDGEDADDEGPYEEEDDDTYSTQADTTVYSTVNQTQYPVRTWPSLQNHTFFFEHENDGGQFFPKGFPETFQPGGWSTSHDDTMYGWI